MRRTIAVAAVAAAISGGAALAQDKPVEMRFSHWIPPSHPLAKTGFEPWAKSVQEASGGSIKIALYPAQQLGKAPDHYDMVRDGIVDGMFSDVTHRKKLEEQVSLYQRMEAVGQLTGGVAHDFNNILASILANSHFLMQDLAESDPRRKDAEEIKLAAERGAGLTRQLLAFSRRQVLEVAALLPVAGRGRGGGAVDQRVQALLGGRIETVVEPVELQCLHDRVHVGLRGHALRLVRPIHDARHHERGQDAEDDDDDEDFDQGKTAGFHFPTNWLSWKIGSRMAMTMNRTTPPIKITNIGSMMLLKAETDASTSPS